jgi:hypothetical protein
LLGRPVLRALRTTFSTTSICVSVASTEQSAPRNANRPTCRHWTPKALGFFGFPRTADQARLRESVSFVAVPPRSPNQKYTCSTAPLLRSSAPLGRPSRSSTEREILVMAYAQTGNLTGSKALSARHTINGPNAAGTRKARRESTLTLRTAAARSNGNAAPKHPL